MMEYHDGEWGVPVRDDRVLFEFLVLEGAQAGLSWETILNKREAYRRAFDNFEPSKVARFDEARLGMLMDDAGIVRNRAKLWSAVGNARAVLALQAEYGSFAEFLWAYVGEQPLDGRRFSSADVPAATPLSERLGRDLYARGMRFVGPTIVYSFMQAVGLCNDHLTECFRYRKLRGRRPKT